MTLKQIWDTFNVATKMPSETLSNLIDVWNNPKTEEKKVNVDEIDPKEFTEIERMFDYSSNVSQDDQFINSNFWKITIDNNSIDDLIKDIE